MVLPNSLLKDPDYKIELFSIQVGTLLTLSDDLSFDLMRELFHDLL